MTNISGPLTKKSDLELVKLLGIGTDGSSQQEQVKFEMQRRLMVAQNAAAGATAVAAEATCRAAKAAEKYTTATWVLIAVTVVGNLVGVFFQGKSAGFW